MDFPPNSQKARVPDEPKKIERVTSAETVRRKRGLGRRLKETFIEGDSKTAMEYVTRNVVIPSVREMFAEAIHSGIDKLIHGEVMRPRRGSGGGRPTTDYHTMSGSGPSRRAAQPQQMLSRSSRERQEFDEIIMPSRADAETVLEHMYELLARFDSVSVAEFYALTGVQSSHVDHRWGWTDLRGTKPVRYGNTKQHVLSLPKPEQLG